MALDEVLLDTAADRGHPLLRLYAWREPAATFGYFQKYADVERMTPLRPLIRRLTAGGLVPHDADWTYSLVFPPSHHWYGLRAAQSYQQVHNWLRQSFEQLGLPAVLAPARRAEAPGQCFVGAEQFDLLWQDRKIAGAAQRRNRRGLLIQGSVQPPAGLTRASWERSLCGVASHTWGIVWVTYALEPELIRCARVLAAEKYGRPAYNQRR